MLNMARAKPIIVVVEDEPTLRADIAEELRHHGYAVVEAENGKAGFLAIEENQPDLVLSDINMPHENGFALVKKIRELGPRYADVPFIFLSALSTPAQVVDGIRIGADDYITKPVDYDLLLVKIKSHLTRNERLLEKWLHDQLGISIGGGALTGIIIIGVLIILGSLGLLGLYMLKVMFDIDIFKDTHFMDMF